MNTKALGVIPARYASTRLPGKSLVSLCGKPLIQWVLEAVRRARSLADVVVATDDARICAAVEACGGKAVMTRADHPSGTDRVAEAAEAWGDCGIVVNIQGDEPLIDPKLIDRLVEVMAADEAWDMATAATPIRRAEDVTSPSVVKVVTDSRGRALYFSRAVIPHVRDGDVPLDGLYRRHLGIYAYRRAFLERLVRTPPCRLELAEKLEQLRALDLGARMVVVDTIDEGMGVDTPQDVAYAESRLRERMGVSAAGDN